MTYEYDNETEYKFDQEIDKMNRAEIDLRHMSEKAFQALNLHPSEEMSEIDKIRQTALERINGKFTKEYVEEGNSPDTYSGRHDYRRAYCQSFANQLNVGYAWEELNGSRSMYDHRELQPAQTNDLGKPVSPRIAYYEDNTEYGPASFTFVDAMALTQDQYDKLKMVQQDNKTLENAFDQPTPQKGLAKGEYETVQNKRGETYIHGKPVFENAPEDVYFKASYGIHTFSKQEITSLLNGDQISIPARSGNTEVQLGAGKIGNHEYFGIQKTTPQKERSLPDLPNTDPTTPQMEAE